MASSPFQPAGSRKRPWNEHSITKRSNSLLHIHHEEPFTALSRLGCSSKSSSRNQGLAYYVARIVSFTVPLSLRLVGLAVTQLAETSTYVGTYLLVNSATTGRLPMTLGLDSERVCIPQRCIGSATHCVLDGPDGVPWICKTERTDLSSESRIPIIHGNLEQRSTKMHVITRPAARHRSLEKGGQWHA